MELCNGHAPKMGNAFRAMYLVGSGTVPPFKKPDAWSPQAHAFMERVLDIDQTTRAKPQELVDHSFCNDGIASIDDMRKKLQEIFQAGAITNAGFG